MCSATAMARASAPCTAGRGRIDCLPMALKRHTGPLFLGIDAGTSGVRACAVTQRGEVVGQASVALGPDASTRDAERHEQSPQAWWQAVQDVVTSLMARLSAGGCASDAVQALAVDGTSGTLVCLDGRHEPVRAAIMYNDPRGLAEADELNAAAGSFCEVLGYRFASSYALAKILWFSRNEPELYERTARFAHQADYIVGRLTGIFDVSDYSNALKTGYHLIEERWPEWLSSFSGVLERLPRIIAPATPIGPVADGVADALGLPRGCTVVAGASDGTAACLASGIRLPGDYNTTLGTTLVFKGLSERLCTHPDGLVYSHKLPGGRWLPGAASNTGGEWVNTLFAGQDAAALDAAAASLLPSAHAAYPLIGTGERFPFLCTAAEGFCVPEAQDSAAHFAGCLQGTAFLERLAYDVLDGITGTSGGAVYSTGGGSRSAVWMQCRADATGRIIHRPACPESAFGSAVLAASGAHYGGLSEAIRNMVHVERSFEPDTAKKGRYDEVYGRFCDELERRAYR